MEPVPTTQPSGPVARYLATEDPADRTRAGAALAAAAEPRSAGVSERLHEAAAFPELEAGRTELTVPVGHGRERRVVVRIPRGYRPGRAWPLILAYHPSGGSAGPMLGRVEGTLGRDVEQYVVAAPHHYRQTGLDHPRPVSSEHAAVLEALRRHVHVDSDRVYALGFSLGGYTAWNLATLHADLLAGAVPMASTFSVPADVDGLWSLFFPNFRHLPILSVWGGRDRLNVPGLNGRRSSNNMARLNRRLGRALEDQGAGSVVHHEVPRAGHGGFRPPKGPLRRVLSAERVHYPESVHHVFRYIHQASAYWVEGLEWAGPGWNRPWPEVERRPGESKPAALARTIRELLGEIRGTVDGQVLTVDTRHLADLTVWLGDGMVDWKRPVTVVHNGREVFRGRLEPDPELALAQAVRTRDFDRLRWAGVRIDAARETARPVTPDESLPPVLREVLD